MSTQLEYGSFEKDLASYARSIGHPSCVAILIAIARHGNEVKGEIIEVPPLSRPTVLQHLRELKSAGIVQGKIFGQKCHYSINMVELEKFSQCFSQFMTEVTNKKN
jgi:ArsR family transcriptional regulator, arsenate/arsenite/antimonite-responsive transcriptional repressor